ncbi:hypothetical protein N9N00_03480 [Schleiferiaceae bacterium]|jgi:hypothetical protein|nr:hypothetical protein [Schleiferiaceae bacterium]
MRRMLIVLSLIAAMGWSFPMTPRQAMEPHVDSVQDSIFLEEGQALDSAWSAHRRALAAGVNQGRSMDMERYTIQVFSGRRMEANQWYGRLQDSLGPQQVMLHFDEPNFKVSVGLYPIRLAAEHDLRLWRRNFPQAFVVRAPDVQPGK